MNYIVTIDGAAKILGVTRERVRQVSQSPAYGFPVADFTIDGGRRAWSQALVDWVAKFRAAQGRWPRPDERPEMSNILLGDSLTAAVIAPPEQAWKCYAVRWFRHDLDGTALEVSEGRIFAMSFGYALRVLRGMPEKESGLIPVTREIASEECYH